LLPGLADDQSDDEAESITRSLLSQRSRREAAIDPGRLDPTHHTPTPTSPVTGALWRLDTSFR